MMRGLELAAGDLVTLANVALPVGSYIKIQPQSVDFLDITDPRAVLEHALRNFATLTVGDCIAVNYNGKIYGLAVLEVRPNEGRGGICVLETDLQVEFAPPVGYQEPPPIRADKSLVRSHLLAHHRQLTARSLGRLSGHERPTLHLGRLLLGCLWLFRPL